MINKNDIILAIIIFILGITSFYFLEKASVGQGRIVKVYSNSKLYGTYSIDQDRTVVIKEKGHINKINIKKGKVAMSFSDCKGQDCVKMGVKSSPNESIVCLPNKVIVEIEGEGGEVDAISK